MILFVLCFVSFVLNKPFSIYTSSLVYLLSLSLFQLRRKVAVMEGVFYVNCSAYSSHTVDGPVSVSVTGVMNSADWTQSYTLKNSRHFL